MPPYKLFSFWLPSNDELTFRSWLPLLACVKLRLFGPAVVLLFKWLFYVCCPLCFSEDINWRMGICAVPRKCPLMWFPLAIRLPPLLFLLPDAPSPATFDKFIFFPLSKWKRSWDNNRNSNLTNVSELVLLTGMASIMLRQLKLSFVRRLAGQVLRRSGSGFTAYSDKSYWAGPKRLFYLNWLRWVVRSQHSQHLLPYFSHL